MSVFDLNLQGHVFQQSKDHIDRIKQEVRMLERQNFELQNQLNNIRSNPNQIIQSFKAKIQARIHQLRQQNYGIQQLIQKSKIPGYAQMTKKKPSYLAQTPGKQSKRQLFYQQDERDRRDPFESIQMSQKYEASTCQNYPTHHISTQNPILSLQPLQDQQLQSRAQLTSQLLQVIQRTTQMASQIQKITAQSDSRNANSINSIRQNGRKFQQIIKYKQKLLILLKKLKARQNNQQQIVREYQIMYDETLKKFKQATQLLNQLSSVKTDQNLDDLYAEALQLEQRLTYINEQLQRVDQSQWLKDIQSELLYALKRLSINPPEFKPSSQNIPPNQLLRERIDSLAQILIECAIIQKADQKQKIALIKIYHQEQKQNNKKIIKAMQNKEQGLSKKLIDLQINS